MARPHRLMHHKRRSGRIAKELPILLLGADTTGKVFSEHTNTVVLSRHGAGVISRYCLAPDEVLTLRLPGSPKEAEVRLVGQIGGERDRYVYGLAFVDPNLEFWPMEFPPPEPFEPETRHVTLECNLCHAQQLVQHDEIEEDVYAVNASVLRFCESCGTSTSWKKVSGKAPADAPPSASGTTPRQVSDPNPPLPSASSVAPRRSALPQAPMASTSSPLLASAPAPTATSVTGQNTSTATTLADQQFASPFATTSYSTAPLDILPMAAAGVIVADPSPAQSEPPEAKPNTDRSASSSIRSVDGNGRPVNRRKHIRVRVSYHACIRQGESGDDIVECENVSKGGLCFRSRKRYALDSRIEIAAPFSPGEPALFVPAKIKRIERLGDTQVFRYGIAYLDSKPAISASPGFL